MLDLSSIQSLAAAAAAGGEFSGVLRLQQGSTVEEAAYGFAHRGWQIPNTPRTRFRTASISKMFTALATLQLIDSGRLAMDTPIVTYLDLQHTTLSPAITLAHLLTMTAGIADWFDESGDWEANWEALRRAHPLYLLRSDADYLPLFANTPPLSPPGAAHLYNNASYILLGLALSKATGLPYPEVIRRQVFEPLGMEGADFLSLDGIDSQVAEGYLPGEREGAWVKNIYSVTPQAAADGGAHATAEDLVRFSQGLRRAAGPQESDLLSPALARLMLTPQVPQFPEKIRGYSWYYSFGVIFILDDERRVVRWGHTGEEEGISCRLYYYPEQDLDVVILGNQSGCAGSLGWAIHDAILEQVDPEKAP